MYDSPYLLYLGLGIVGLTLAFALARADAHEFARR